VYRRFEAAFNEEQLARWFSLSARSSTRNPSFAGFAKDPRPGHWHFDRARSAADQLEACGLSPEHIYVADLCTASHPEMLCSYRRDGTPAGRMVAAIKCPRRRP
jgi:copper oxidase (laccase) domain-containing protein